MRARFVLVVCLALAVGGLVAVPAAVGAAVPTAHAGPVAGAADPVPRAPYEVEPFRLRPSDDAGLARAWRAWSARTDRYRYRLTFDGPCDCPSRRPVVTVVEGRTVVSVTRRGRDRQLRRGFEIERLYRLVRHGYLYGDEVRVRFRHGVPVALFVDWNDEGAGEELSATVRVSTS